MPKKPNPKPAPPKELPAYQIELPGRRVCIVQKAADFFSLNFHKGDGEASMITGVCLSRDACQAVFQLLAMHGFSVKPIAMTMEIPSMTWKPFKRVKKRGK